MKDTYYIYKYAIKYYLQGDSWTDAKFLAEHIVRSFK